MKRVLIGGISSWKTIVKSSLFPEKTYTNKKEKNRLKEILSLSQITVHGGVVASHRLHSFLDL